MITRDGLFMMGGGLGGEGGPEQAKSQKFREKINI